MQDDAPSRATGIPSVRVEIGPSTHLIGQLGLIAVDSFHPGAIVVPVDLFGDETYYSWEDFQNLTPATQKKILDFCIGDEGGFYAPPDLNNLSAAWYMNHSCSPNVGFDQDDNAVALHEIFPGDELVYDYAVAESNPSFSFVCMCGSSTCRGIFSGSDWRTLPDMMERYRFATSLMRSKIDRFISGTE